MSLLYIIGAGAVFFIVRLLWPEGKGPKYKCSYHLDKKCNLAGGPNCFMQDCEILRTHLKQKEEVRKYRLYN